MKKNICIIALLAICLISSLSLSAQAPEWVGVYRNSTTNGNEKVVTTITLQSDNNYMFQSSSSGNNTILVSIGKIEIKKNGKEFILIEEHNGQSTTYKRKNNIMTSIAKNGIKIPKGQASSLQKIDERSITEKYWKLIEIRGNAVVPNPAFPQEAYITFKKGGNEVTGRGGCNSFRGTYTLTGETQINLAQVISTMMACPDMELESQFLPILELADNYTISPDGKYLSLNKGRMAPLARFEVVYLK